jgi:hypothetical protein
MYYQYWSLEAGWKNKKNHRTKALDWKRTIENAFGYKNNRVYWGKGEVDLEEVELNLRKERGNGTN